MNTDIRLQIGFWHHPKTKRLIKDIGLEGVRSLQILWCWVAQNRSDGNISDLDCDDIEAAADWNGQAGDFYMAIKDRWLDEVNGELFIHDWIDHNTWAAESEQRSNESRLLKLAQVNRSAYEELIAQGCTGIDKYQYMQLKNSRNSDTLAERNSDTPAERLRGRSGPAPAPAPAPSPIPSPVPSPVLKKEKPRVVDTTLVGNFVPTTEPQTKTKTTEPKCPHKDIIEVYHKILPELPKVAVWTEARQALLRRAWREDPSRQSIEWWESLFRSVRGQPFLMGKGGKDWIADLEWLIRPKNLPKVIEGRYRPREPTANILSTSGEQSLRNAESLLKKLELEIEDGTNGQEEGIKTPDRTLRDTKDSQRGGPERVQNPGLPESLGTLRGRTDRGSNMEGCVRLQVLPETS